ncbi:related to trichodiene oxygenase [cytochrome P450] [Phialocephala subalpina]|uniref:Related to trichodiene oxygenase [cytochrome P450] n=1 Tax=Phialocephala subalpina TaxID=576137 RepID=A0A1L7XL63_9HELO|nr:related to trichodiene oxygenase [cytochrome P450] [Phialocephala subalpina]
MLPNFDQWSATQVFLASAVGWVVYCVGVAIHRLYFSKYAKFPGPKLAGLTYGYMFYYDVIAGSGQYIYKIKELHEEYNSPIIRISPHELHVIDPDFYDILFASFPARRDKPPTWSHAFSNIDSTFGTTRHDIHRLRRNALAPFFSASSLRKLEPLILSKITSLISVFRRYQKAGEQIPMRPAFGALTSDIIAEYCFGISENYIEAEGFNRVVMEATDALSNNTHITVNAQWLPKVLDMLPEKIMESVVGPGMAKFNSMKHHCIKKIQETISTRGDFHDVKHRTIFQELLENQSLPEKDKSADRLWQEAQLLLSAGTVTTAGAISAAFVYLLLDHERLAVLLEELECAMPDINKPLTAAELEQLPYLTGVVQETLRLVSGVSYRLTRSAPTEALQLGKWTIPPNTALSMHYPLIHLSPTVYPEPWSFIPERWLPSPPPKTSYPIPSRPEGIPEASTKYLMPFSKGTRNCLGWPLANAELYLTIPIVARTFLSLERDDEGKVVGVKGMKLFETDRRDTDMKKDLGFSAPEDGRGNMRIVIE